MTGGCARCCLPEAFQSSCWCPVVWHRELRPISRWGVTCGVTFHDLFSLLCHSYVFRWCRELGRDLPHVPDAPACCPCCMHWCRCFQEAPENWLTSRCWRGAAVCHLTKRAAFWKKWKRGEAGESHFVSPHWYKRRRHTCCESYKSQMKTSPCMFGSMRRAVRQTSAWHCQAPSGIWLEAAK